jgi:hypothetical protein
MEENMVDEVKMPERWEMPLACDYRPAANGDWVRAEDVEPLVDEIARLLARIEVLEFEIDCQKWRVEEKQ